jgi:hypothetical protein
MSSFFPSVSLDQRTLVAAAALTGVQLTVCILGLILYLNPILLKRSRPAHIRLQKIILCLAGLVNVYVAGSLLFESFWINCRTLNILGELSFQLILIVCDTVIITRMNHLVIDNMLSKLTRYSFHFISILLLWNKIIASIVNILPAAMDSIDGESACLLIEPSLPFRLWHRGSDLAILLFVAVAVIAKYSIRLRGARRRDYSDISLMIRCLLLSVLSIIGILLNVSKSLASPFTMNIILQSAFILQIYLVTFEQGLNRTLDKILTKFHGCRQSLSSIEAQSSADRSSIYSIENRNTWGDKTLTKEDNRISGREFYTDPPAVSVTLGMAAERAARGVKSTSYQAKRTSQLMHPAVYSSPLRYGYVLPSIAPSQSISMLEAPMSATPTDGAATEIETRF